MKPVRRLAVCVRVPILFVCLAGAINPALAADEATGRAAASAPSSAPVVHAASDTQVIEKTLRASLRDVWEAFTTAEGFKKLGVAHCDVDMRVGGLIRTHYNPKGVLGDEGTIHNEILAWEPLRMLAFRIHKPPQNFPFSEATWKSTWSVATFSDLGDGRTHIRLAGMGYPATEEGQKMRKFFEQGNQWVLDNLQRRFEESPPLPMSQAHADRPLAPILHERVVELPRADVWSLLSTAAGWKRFLGVEASIEPYPGGKFELYFVADAPAGQRGSEGCTVLSVVPEELLSYTWNAPPNFARARPRHTWVVIRLESLGPARTRVRLDHLGFAEQASKHPDEAAEWTEVRTYFQRAWGNVLTALKALELQPAAPDKARDQADADTPTSKSATARLAEPRP